MLAHPEGPRALARDKMALVSSTWLLRAAQNLGENRCPWTGLAVSDSGSDAMLSKIAQSRHVCMHNIDNLLQKAAVTQICHKFAPQKSCSHFDTLQTAVRWVKIDIMWTVRSAQGCVSALVRE